ncbi:MAG: 23S rRNA pseudouridine2605 synthase [Granulosicoccus sp.]|jgi:23S rRNA pseudouridine2605 synthase
MKKPFKKDFFSKQKNPNTTDFPTDINFDNLRLNKFMAHCGVGTRRACEIYIKKGLVKVNEEVATEAAYRVQKEDVIIYEGKVLQLNKKYVYVLLNKPKKYVPTFEKLEGEKSFANIFSDKIKVTINPIGNLAKTSLGLVLLTDDEVLLEKFSNPANPIRSIFHLILEKPMSVETRQEMEQSLIKKYPNIHTLSHVKGKRENEIGIELKGGTDEEVAKIFEEIDFPIEKIDRVFLNGLTKKDLPRGRFRFLTEQEAIFLKHF